MVPSPGWSPGRPRTGSKAQKEVKMEALRWILCCFVTSITFWRCFAYFMNNILIILDVTFIVMFV